jgi:heme/copper-type cytochrome/quinol oxidase subunit 4
MRRASLWTLTIASVLFGVFALVMALLEVVHLALGQSEHFAATFAVQALVVAAVFMVGALLVARDGEDAHSG